MDLDPGVEMQWARGQEACAEKETSGNKTGGAPKHQTKTKM